MKRLARYAVLITLALLVVSSASVMAQVPPRLPHIEDLRVEDLNRVDWTAKSLIAGGTFIAHFKVVVEVSQPDATLALSTNLSKVGDTYWKLNNDYEGINTATWQPGLREINFSAVMGEASLTLTGKVPDNYTVTALPDGYLLHRETNVTIVRLVLANTGQILDEKTALVTDGRILEFDSLLAQKMEVLEKAPMDPRFKAFYEGVLGAAGEMKTLGEVESGIRLLKTLPASGDTIPPPPSTIAGIVLDSATGTPIPDASVTVAGVSTKTGSDGAFTLSAPLEEATLRVEAGGYEPVTVKLPALRPYTYYTILLQETPPPAPPPPPPSVDPVFLYTTIALGAAAGGLGAFMLRASSMREYVYRRVEDQARKLDVTLIKLGRIDRSVASEVSEVKNELERIAKKR